jgi:hypothetical protein
MLNNTYDVGTIKRVPKSFCVLPVGSKHFEHAVLSHLQYVFLSYGTIHRFNALKT